MKTNTMGKPRRWPKPRDNKPWSPHDMKRLRALARERASSRQAAARLGRSQGGVKYKAMVEGIRFHAIEQPRGAQVKALRTRRRRERNTGRERRVA